MYLVWKKLFDNIIRNSVLVFNKDLASLIKVLRGAPLTSVVKHKIAFGWDMVRKKTIKTFLNTLLPAGPLFAL